MGPNRNVRRLTLVSAAAALVLGAGVALAGPSLAETADGTGSGPEAAAGDAGRVVTNRDEILARARTWLDPQTPYDQSGRKDGYRTDCSGYVAMAWGLTPDANGGPNTIGLGGMSVEITKDELQPGDILLDVTGDGNSRHVVMFGGWANPERSAYVGFETAFTAGGSVTRTVPYPYFPEKNPEQYTPRRANHL